MSNPLFGSNRRCKRDVDIAGYKADARIISRQIMSYLCITYNVKGTILSSQSSMGHGQKHMDRSNEK